MLAGDRPLCSVVIPAYQAGAFVGQAIDSVLHGTYREFEVIVVNDGSSDNTAEVLRGYGEAIRAIDQENGGPAVARNTGIAAARGDLVAFLDADDWWAPNRLERCVQYLQVHPEVDVVATDAYLVEGDTPMPQVWYGDLGRYEFPEPAGQLETMLDCNFMFTSTLMARSVLDQVGPFDPAFLGTEDYDLWIRMLRQGMVLGLLREPLSYYRLRAESLSHNALRQWNQHLNVLEKHLPELWPAGARAPVALYFQIARGATAQRRYRSALEFLSMGARTPGMSSTRKARAVGRGVVDVVSAVLHRS